MVKVIPKKDIFEKVREAVHKANDKGIEIEAIALTLDEVEELYLFLCLRKDLTSFLSGFPNTSDEFVKMVRESHTVFFGHKITIDET